MVENRWFMPLTLRDVDFRKAVFPGSRGRSYKNPMMAKFLNDLRDTVAATSAIELEHRPDAVVEDLGLGDDDDQPSRRVRRRVESEIDRSVVVTTPAVEGVDGIVMRTLAMHRRHGNKSALAAEVTLSNIVYLRKLATTFAAIEAANDDRESEDNKSTAEYGDDSEELALHEANPNH